MEVKPGYKQTEVGVIPEEWELLPVDMLGKVIDGDRGVNYPSDQDFRESGHCLFLNAGNVTKGGFRFDECAFITREKDAKLSKGKLKREDIVLTTRGTVGNFAYFDSSVPFDNLRINSGMVILRKESPRLTSRFLYAVLQSHSVGMQIERLSFGSAQPQLTVKGISKLAITVPSVSEQRAIAEALSDVDALLGGLDRLIAKKRDLKQAAMQQLLTGHTRLPGFHGEWEVQSVADLEKRKLVRLSRGKVISKKDIESKPGDFPIYSSSVHNDGLFGRYGEFMFDEELITWSVDGGGNFFHRPKHKFSVTNVCGFMRVATSRISYLFLAAHLQLLHSRKSFDYQSKAHPSVVRKEYEVQLPTLAEQIAIAEVLTDIDAELAELERRREKTRAIKQAMMQELLTGKTRLI